MSSFVVFGSRCISLAERSRSNFALVISLLCVGEDIQAMPMMTVSGRSKLMRVRFPTGTRMRRSSNEGHSLIGRRACA
jgi:hypothetical protein